MGITTEEFITHFHSINGTTIAERRKSLFSFLNAIGETESKEIDFSRLHPRTPLEEKFKVEALLYFRRVPDLIDVLKSENPILIKRILKNCPWFVEEAFQNVNEEQLVRSLFPSISFNAKIKLLNQLSVHLKDSQQADNLFEAIEKNYGLHLASKLLPACSLDLIITCIKFRRITLTSTQLVTIIKKNPEKIQSFLEVIKDKCGSVKFKQISLHLARNDFELYLTLYKPQSMSFRLGRRLTDKFVRKNKEDVIKEPRKHFTFLHEKQIAKSLNRDYETLYFNLFPKYLYSLKFNSVFSTLKNLPRRMRDVNLLLDTFKKVYNSELWEHPEFVDHELLKMLSPEERKRRTTKPAEEPPKYKSEIDRICHLKTEESIPQIKKTISLTSKVRRREKLVCLLVKTCSINKDTSALAEVCQYMILKHRNDKRTVRSGFLNELSIQFKLQDLEEKHWTPINKLLQLFVLNDESFHNAQTFHKLYIYFRLKNNLPVTEQLVEWEKSYGKLTVIEEEPKYEKQCLLCFGQIIPEMCKQKEGSKKENDYHCLFIDTLMKWNKKYPKDQISLLSYPDSMDSLKSALLKERSAQTIKNVLLYFIDMNHLAEMEEWLNLYLKTSYYYIDIDIVYWVLNHEPLTAFRHIESVTRYVIFKNSFCRHKHFFWTFLRNYQHLEIFQKVVNILLTTLAEKEASYYQPVINSAIEGLSYILSENEFGNLIVSYCPMNLEANAENEEGRRMYATQKCLGKSLKNLLPASSAQKHLLTFSKGDYLKFVCNVLHQVSRNTNENNLLPFCEELAGRAVSVRKHALHVAFGNLNREQIRDFTTKFMEAEKNASICKFILKHIFNLFVASPDELSWELLRLSTKGLDVNDEEALGILLQTDKIPTQYITRYIIFMWSFLDNLPRSERAVDFHKRTLLRLLKSDVV